MNDPIQFMNNAAIDSLDEISVDINQGFKQAQNGLGLQDGYQALQSGLETVKNTEAQAYEAMIKGAQMAIIAWSVAPSYCDARDTNIQSFNNKKTTLLTKFATQWEEYANNFDSAARGKWATRARQIIKEQAKGLRAI